MRKAQGEDPETTFKKYQELMRETQRIKPLRTDEEIKLFGRTPTRPESEPWDQCQD